MEVIIRTSDLKNAERVNRFLSALRFPKMSIQTDQFSQACGSFLLEVIEGDSMKDEEVSAKIENVPHSLLVFNRSALESSDPKVIYTTDHSRYAHSNLEKFKLLKPAGFAGATVISESETISQKMTLNELTKQILERIRSTVQVTRANLIIANYDFNNFGRKKAQIECVVQMVRQNKCHVLILKA
jgi:hypothetical protein